MLDWAMAHLELLFTVWLCGAVVLAMWFGTMAEMHEAHGEPAPGMIWSTTIACLWPLAAIAALGYMLAQLWRAFAR